MLQRFESMKAMLEQKYAQFNAASAKFYQEINARRADPCTNSLVAFTYYQAKSLAADIAALVSELKELYQLTVTTSIFCTKTSSKSIMDDLVAKFTDIGPKLGVVDRSLAAMQGKITELACDEQEIVKNGQLVTAQGDIDPDLLQQGGAMTEVQGDSVDNTGEGLQDERNFNTGLLIMVWDSGSAKDDIFSVSMSGYGPLGTTPKGGRQVFAPERIQPGKSYTVSLTTVVTEVGAGTWSIIVSYKGTVLVPAKSGSNSGSVSFTIPAE